MRKSSPLCLLLLSTAIFIFSCSKNGDSPAPAPTKTVEELLTMQTWKIEEARLSQNNVVSYYKRGGGNTIFDADSIKFKSDFTGVYTNSAGTSPFTWSFVDAEKTKIKAIHGSSNLNVNWENMSITETALRYTEYYTIPGSSSVSLTSVYRTKR